MIAKQIYTRSEDDDDWRKQPKSKGGARDEIHVPLPKGRGLGYRNSRKGRATGARPIGWSPGKQAKATSAMVDYLIEGDTIAQGQRAYDREGTGRVEEIRLVNLPGFDETKSARPEDLRKAGRFMAQSASLNTTISSPGVWHFTLSAAPEDADKIRKNPDFWLDVGNESLRALGMEGHQMAIVVHKDTAHPHCHILVNRVDPLSTRAKNPYTPVIKLERVMRQTEDKYGLRPVLGRHVDPKTHEWIRRDAPIPKVRNQLHDKTEHQAWVRSVKNALIVDKPFSDPKIKTWRALENRLKKSRLTLRQAGGGYQLVGKVKRGDTEVYAVCKLSSIAGKAGNKESLEAKFGPWGGALADELQTMRQMASKTAKTHEEPHQLSQTAPGPKAKIQTTVIPAKQQHQEKTHARPKRAGFRQWLDRFTRQFDAFSLAPGTPPESLGRVPSLSGGNVARDSRSGAMLLPNHEIALVDQRRSAPHRPVRRLGPEGLTPDSEDSNHQERIADALKRHQMETERRAMERMEKERIIEEKKKLLLRPARVAGSPQNYPATDSWPGAASSWEMAEALREADDRDLIFLASITQDAGAKAKAALEAARKGNRSLVDDLYDVTTQLAEGLGLVQREIERRGIDGKPVSSPVEAGNLKPTGKAPNTPTTPPPLRMEHHASPDERRRALSELQLSDDALVSIYTVTKKALKDVGLEHGQEAALAKLELKAGLEALFGEAKVRGVELPVDPVPQRPRGLIRLFGGGIGD